MAAGNGLTAAADLAAIKTLIAVVSGALTSTGFNWVAMYTTQFTTAKAGATEWLAASNTNYARIAMGAAGVGWSITSFVTGTGVVINNTNQLQTAAVAGTGQTLFSVGFCDALTSGNVNWFSDLASSVAVAIGILVQFNALTDIAFTLN